MTTDASSRVGSTMSGCTRTRLIEKVGTRLTIMTGDEHQERRVQQPAARPAAAGDEGHDHRRQRQAGGGRGRDAGEEVSVQRGRSGTSSSVLKRARRSAQQVANSIATAQPTPRTSFSVQR